MRGFVMGALVVAGAITSAFGESTVVLKSGETLQGDILSDTNGVLQLKVHNANRTISYQRDISHADIQNIQTENAGQAAERTVYEALSKFQLNPNQEQSADYCGQVITAFQRFLTDYPKSDKAPSIQQRLQAWQAELKHVSDGEVKFGDKWMTPEDKAPLAEHWQKQMDVQAAQNTVESLKKKLQELQRQRDTLANNVAAAQGNLAAAQQRLGTLQDSQVPVYQNVTTPQYSGRRQSGANATTTSQLTRDRYGNPVYTTVANPERAGVMSDIATYQQQVATGPQMLANLDAKIQDVQVRIPKAEQDYKNALAQLNEPSSPSPHTSYPPPPPGNASDKEESAAQAVIGTWRQDNGDLFIFSSDKTVVAIGNKGQWVRHSTWAVEANGVVIYWPDGSWDKLLLPLDPRNTINTNKNGDRFVYSKVATP